MLTPLPNHLFPRDTSCWVYGGVSINPMAKAARRRETLHIEAIYRFHPLFADGRVRHAGTAATTPTTGRPSIEGGDVLVLGHGAVLVGMGERTTPHGRRAAGRAPCSPRARPPR